MIDIAHCEKVLRAARPDVGYVKLAYELEPVPFQKGNQDICGCFVLIAQLFLYSFLLTYLINLVHVFEEVDLGSDFGNCSVDSMHFDLNTAVLLLRNGLQVYQVLLFQHESEQEQVD